jgi:predicted transposase YdaD
VADGAPADVTSRPHDALFRSAFEHPADAAAQLRHALPPTLVDAIDWSTLRAEPGSFIDPELEGRESDLLLREIS